MSLSPEALDSTGRGAQEFARGLEAARDIAHEIATRYGVGAGQSTVSANTRAYAAREVAGKINERLLAVLASPAGDRPSEARVPDNILVAIGRYGDACRRQHVDGHDLNSVAAWEALLDEIRPLSLRAEQGEGKLRPATGFAGDQIRDLVEREEATARAAQILADRAEQGRGGPPDCSLPDGHEGHCEPVARRAERGREPEPSEEADLQKLAGRLRARLSEVEESDGSRMMGSLRFYIEREEVDAVFRAAALRVRAPQEEQAGDCRFCGMDPATVCEKCASARAAVPALGEPSEDDIRPVFREGFEAAFYESPTEPHQTHIDRAEESAWQHSQSRSLIHTLRR